MKLKHNTHMLQNEYIQDLSLLFLHLYKMMYYRSILPQYLCNCALLSGQCTLNSLDGLRGWGVHSGVWARGGGVRVGRQH